VVHRARSGQSAQAGAEACRARAVAAAADRGGEPVRAGDAVVGEVDIEAVLGE